MSRISFLQEMLTSLFDRKLDGEVALDERSFEELCQALLSSRGELSGSRIAMALLDRFESADAEVRQQWFNVLLSQYDIDAGDAVSAATSYAENQTTENWRRLTQSTESRRRQFSVV